MDRATQFADDRAVRLRAICACAATGGGVAHRRRRSLADRVRHITVRHPKANMSDHLPTIGLQVVFAEDAVRFEAEPVLQVAVEEENAGPGPTSTRNLIRAVLEADHLTEAEIADEIGRKLDSVGRTLRRYSSTASSPDNRWFNRLPSGRWENLPMGLARVSDAG